MAASAYWTGIRVMTSSHSYDEWVSYSVLGDVVSETGTYGSLQATFYEHEEGGTFFLKSYDYSAEIIPVKNSWALVFCGDVLNAETFERAIKIELCDYSNATVGGTAISDRTDFYLGCLSMEYGVENGQSWYCWMHVSVDDTRKMNVLSSGIGLNGEPVIVGGGSATPEPSCALLLLIGIGVLGLRRRPAA